uniref:FBA_2 domain-containing protein n=1 Tax=Steinernema glaseri TaxID=37863 RepID=A0A1I7ZP35_9BILA
MLSYGKKDLPCIEVTYSSSLESCDGFRLIGMWIPTGEWEITFLFGLSRVDERDDLIQYARFVVVHRNVRKGKEVEVWS